MDREELYLRWCEEYNREVATREFVPSDSESEGEVPEFDPLDDNYRSSHSPSSNSEVLSDSDDIPYAQNNENQVTSDSTDPHTISSDDEVRSTSSLDDGEANKDGSQGVHAHAEDK